MGRAPISAIVIAISIHPTEKTRNSNRNVAINCRYELTLKFYVDFRLRSNHVPKKSRHCDTFITLITYNAIQFNPTTRKTVKFGVHNKHKLANQICWHQQHVTLVKRFYPDIEVYSSNGINSVLLFKRDKTPTLKALKWSFTLIAHCSVLDKSPKIKLLNLWISFHIVRKNSHSQGRKIPRHVLCSLNV